MNILGNVWNNILEKKKFQLFGARRLSSLKLEFYLYKLYLNYDITYDEGLNHPYFSFLTGKFFGNTSFFQFSNNPQHL